MTEFAKSVELGLIPELVILYISCNNNKLLIINNLLLL